MKWINGKVYSGPFLGKSGMEVFPPGETQAWILIPPEEPLATDSVENDMMQTHLRVMKLLGHLNSAPVIVDPTFVQLVDDVINTAERLQSWVQR